MPSLPRPRRAVLPSGVRRVDRRAGRFLYRAPAPRRANDLLVWVSTATESGFFWAVVTAIVALTGRRGRRAAVRGALTLGASSLSANLVAKRLIRARRPVARGLRTRTRTPDSPAFPSGHGATAAALAAGIASESPILGAAVGALAFVISYSRLHVGAHALSDVLVGNLYGASVGLVGHLLRRPSTG